MHVPTTVDWRKFQLFTQFVDLRPNTILCCMISPEGTIGIGRTSNHMPDPVFLFGGWEPVARTVMVGTLGYLAIVAMLKLSGARTLSQMNSFDFVITIAIGATFGRALTAKHVALLELLTAISLLVLLQYVAARLQLRLPRLRRLMTVQPVLLFLDGAWKGDAMNAAGVARADLEAAARESGQPSLDQVMAIVLEFNGRLGIIPREAGNMKLPSEIRTGR